MTTKIFKKMTATTLAVLCLSLPLTGIAAAHGRNDNPPPPPRHSDRYDRHDRNHRNSNTVSKAESNRRATTGFIIGAVLGAVIAKNT